MNLVFRAKIRDDGRGRRKETAAGRGECQPPRKRRAESADLRIILADSARKKRAKPLAEYSTL
jgi:hypothetical protein